MQSFALHHREKHRGSKSAIARLFIVRYCQERDVKYMEVISNFVCF